jgi:pyruvate/2-oxoglutarate dehydrogenase complex dihydrolipoamide acyltransferase (E2) component
MSSIEIRIPQLGEGLQEARLVSFLKQPGDPVAQDEPIYEMETDKAVMEIESPAAGVLEEWTARIDDVVPIGAVVGSIAVEDAGTRGRGDTERGRGGEGARGQENTPTPNAQRPTPDLRNAAIPPRTRAYAKEKGLSEGELMRLAQEAGGRLLPEAIDRYLAGNAGSQSEESSTPYTLHPTPSFTDVPLPPRQRTLVYRLQRSAQEVIPATMWMPVGWEAVEAVRAQFKRSAARDNGSLPSQFLLFAWCVTQAAKDHPRFRAALVSDTALRQYDHLHLGIAVARPDDELIMARVPGADALPFETFISAAKAAIRRARDGEDQSSDAMQLSVTNMAAARVRMGLPVVVAPAASTLFVGEVYEEAYPLPDGGCGFHRVANMVLTFDHRIVNGVGAARFLADIRRRVEGLREEFADLFHS